jgi:hypothetical protein
MMVGSDGITTVFCMVGQEAEGCQEDKKVVYAFPPHCPACVRGFGEDISAKWHPLNAEQSPTARSGCHYVPLK